MGSFVRVGEGDAMGPGPTPLGYVTGEWDHSQE